MDDRYDDVLFSVLKEAKTLPNFFDIVFGFLYRRTDFYHIAKDPNLGVGLPEGVAERLLQQSYRKYIERKEVPQPVCREEVIAAEEIPKPESPQVLAVKDHQSGDKPITSLDSYNGAVYETYSWSQTISDVDIQVKIPEKLSSKHLIVEVTISKVCVKLKNSNTVYLEGDFCRKCKPQETIWSLDNCILEIHLEKSSESWWDCLLQTEPKLDLSKMDCSRPFHELSEEAQAKIEELTWNQERKRQGLPTSDQLDLEKTLKQAWNAEGSPFSGEYDPTQISLS